MEDFTNTTFSDVISLVIEMIEEQNKDDGWYISDDTWVYLVSLFEAIDTYCDSVDVENSNVGVDNENMAVLFSIDSIGYDSTDTDDIKDLMTLLDNVRIMVSEEDDSMIRVTGVIRDIWSIKGE